ncbi:MAG: DsbA family protein [Bradyrhizobium sp.]
MDKFKSIDGDALSRRKLLGLLGGGAALLAATPAARGQRLGAEPGEAAVLHDPAAPVVGNLDGDVSIAEWFDYQCPYCRNLAPMLRQVVHDDGRVRLVLKDWPVLGPVSVAAARIALACKYQGKYDQAHEALISGNSRLTEPRIDELLASGGIDVDRAKRDLATNAGAIEALLARNNEQAEGLGFQGTPSFIIGRFRVPGALTREDLERVIADARKARGDVRDL